MEWAYTNHKVGKPGKQGKPGKPGKLGKLGTPGKQGKPGKAAGQTNSPSYSGPGLSLWKRKPPSGFMWIDKQQHTGTYTQFRC